MKRYNLTSWITLVLILVKYLPSADSFQCFECENCTTLGEDARDYIKECEPMESSSTQGPESSTHVGNSTLSEAAQNSTQTSTTIGLGTNSTTNASSTSTLSSLASSLNKTETSTTKLGSSETSTTTKSSLESTTEKQKSTNSWSMFPNSIEENELNKLKQEPEDRSEELFTWNSRQASGICYVLKLNHDGNEVTKRGCGLKGQNKEQTCQILGKDEPNSECEVCEGNLCNSGTTFRTTTITLLLILFVLKAYIYC